MSEMSTKNLHEAFGVLLRPTNAKFSRWWQTEEPFAWVHGTHRRALAQMDLLNASDMSPPMQAIGYDLAVWATRRFLETVQDEEIYCVAGPTVWAIPGSLVDCLAIAHVLVELNSGNADGAMALMREEPWAWEQWGCCKLAHQEMSARSRR